MTDKTIAVMGYPDKPNKYRFNSNRTLSTSSNSKKEREEQ